MSSHARRCAYVVMFVAVICSAAPAAAELRVVAVTVGGRSGPAPECHLGDVLEVDVAGLSELAADQQPTVEHPFDLYLDGRDMRLGSYSSGVGDPSRLRFDLSRTADNRDAWAALLGGRATGGRQVAVTIGPRGGAQAMSRYQITLVPMHGWRPVVGLVIEVGFLLLMFLTGKWTPMLRDAGSSLPPTAGRWRTVGECGTFSLGRCQMAFWLVLVIAAYVFIWAITGATDTVTPSVLALLGIGSGTALGAALIDNSKQPNAQPRASQGIVNDLLADEGGVSLHRMQMLIWTIVLGVVFGSSVWRGLAMPDFDTTLLALMGISAGAYLGFKFPETDP